jgi:chloride channel 7
MGVAAAFGSPVGGILFSLEEASSFWSKHLTWRAFLGTMIAAVMAKLTKTGFTKITTSGFIEFPDKDAGFEIWELGTFAALAVATGLMGAVFCNTVKQVIRCRRKYFSLGSPTVATRRARVAEVMVIVVFTMGICFWPAAVAGCEPLGVTATALSTFSGRHLEASAEGPPQLGGIICQQDEYSAMAYILLQPKEVAIKTLFSKSMADGAMLDISSLLSAYVIIIGTTILTFGSAIPVGLFIPNILGGACLGRAFGQVLLDFGLGVHPGVYALMGSAGALGGFSRMTISLTVIFLEITNNMYLLLPLMLVIMLSKSIADQFGPSVYDIVLEANPDIALLEDGLDEDHHLVLDGLSVHDVCTAEVVVLRAFENPEQIMKLLVQSTFAGYPVIDREGRLIGLVPRTQLVACLAQRKHEAAGGGGLISVMKLAETAPEVTNWKTPVVRAFAHFRSLGLQHLCVIDEQHMLLGILTRTDFARLCRSGTQGVEEVRRIIHRKTAAIAAGLMLPGYAPASAAAAGGPKQGWQRGDSSAPPSGSTTDEEAGVSGSEMCYGSDDVSATSSKDTIGGRIGRLPGGLPTPTGRGVEACGIASCFPWAASPRNE